MKRNVLKLLETCNFEFELESESFDLELDTRGGLMGAKAIAGAATLRISSIS